MLLFSHSLRSKFIVNLPKFLKMLALSYNYNIDAFLFPLDVYYTGRNKQDEELSKIVGAIETVVKQFIDSKHPIELFFNQNIDAIFSFRMSSLKWLISNKIIIDDFGSLLEEELTLFKSDPKFSVLYQNVLFAIRTNIRSVNSLLNPLKDLHSKGGLDFSEMEEFAETSFKQFVGSLGHVPDFIAAPLLDWVISSLQIEFGVISAFVIHKERLSVDVVKVNELSFFIADAAQAFGAITKELKPKMPKKNKNTVSSFSSSFLAEQEFLAEQDIENLSSH